jgi:DNA anti-recombination protein RmuC
MDKEMDRIAQDVKDIVQTRTAIADKLENLEHRFTSMVEEAKTMAQAFTDRA